MYYDRTLTESFSSLIEQKGKYRWLFKYVKNNDDLDFLIGKSKGKEWISVYRGLSRVLSITVSGKLGKIKVDAAQAYKKIADKAGLNIYGNMEDSSLSCKSLDTLIKKVRSNSKFDRYYNNKKEGYYQNCLSREHGMLGKQNNKFVVIDKEAVIGYDNMAQKEQKFEPMQRKYEKIQNKISVKEPEMFGKKVGEKAIGNELDFLALDQEGNILLIEFKHGSNTSGIYLSSLQIGLYYNIFSDYRARHKKEFDKAVFSMLRQKQEIGLINPNWSRPKHIKKLIPVLIISEENPRSTAKEKYRIILDIVRQERHDQNFLKDIRIYNYRAKKGLSPLGW